MVKKKSVLNSAAERKAVNSSGSFEGEKARPLWAPWRIEYIVSPKNGECFLCGMKKNANSGAGLVVHRGKEVFVMLNMFPYNSGHLMIAPFGHIGDFTKLTKPQRHEMADIAAVSEDVLRRIMKPEGFNIGFNIGKAAGAGVEEHVHLHVVPRWTGDTNFMPVLGDARVVPQSLAETAELIRKNWNCKY
jgi:ATP adenylyltransferase